jgi:DNA-binding SARP family transcriptional activator
MTPPPDGAGMVSAEPIGRGPRSAQPSVHFFLFGSIEVRTATRRLGVSNFPSRKAKQVAELIVCAAGRAVSKDQLIESVWGDKLPRNPSSAMDHIISMLRSTLVADDGSQPIITERGRYRIDLEVATIDIVRFDELVDWASAQPRLGGVADLMEAVELARGPVLEDEMYAPWAEALRERYRQRVQRVQLDIARTALVHDDPALALEMALRAREESSLVLEEGYALCTSALIRQGRRHDARVLMAELERRMAVELDAELAPETVMLGSMLRRSGGSTAPNLVPVAARVTEQIDALPFVGRDTELAILDEAADRVDGGVNEMIVVEGPSGIGKSALLAAVESRPDRPVRSFTCLPSDTAYPLYMAHRLIRSLANEAGLERLSPVGESVPAVFERLAELFDEIGPTVIAIDDLHWADDASLAVIAGLARPHEVTSLLVIATRRVDESSDVGRFDMAFARSRVVQLGPLDRSVVDALPIEYGWEESGGHPGLLEACIEASRIGGHLSAAAVADVLAWVGPGGSAARVALEAAAAIGQSFDTFELAAQLGLSRSTTRDLLSDLERRHLIRVIDPAAGLFEFQAELTRRVLRETVRTRRHLG